MYDYEQGSKSALALIQFYGKATQFISKGTTGGFNDDGDPLPPEADVVLEGVATPIVKFKTSEVDGKNILSGDGYCFFQGANDVLVGMQLTYSGKTYRVIEVYPLHNQSNIKLFDKVHLRSG